MYEKGMHWNIWYKLSKARDVENEHSFLLDIVHNDVLNVSISIKRVQRTNIPKNGLIWSTDNVCYIFSDDTQENNCLTLEKAFTSRRVFVPIRTLQLQFFFPCYIIIVNICGKMRVYKLLYDSLETSPFVILKSFGVIQPHIKFLWM